MGAGGQCGWPAPGLAHPLQIPPHQLQDGCVQVYAMFTNAHLCRTHQQGMAYLALVLAHLRQKGETKFADWIEPEYCTEDEYDW